MNNHAADKNESAPLTGKKVILPLVIEDIQKRAQLGKKKYGTYLESHNGRSALWDAYQEAIDLLMYLRQLIEETDE